MNHGRDEIEAVASSKPSHLTESEKRDMQVQLIARVQTKSFAAMLGWPRPLTLSEAQDLFTPVKEGW